MLFVFVILGLIQRAISIHWRNKVVKLANSFEDDTEMLKERDRIASSGGNILSGFLNIAACIAAVIFCFKSFSSQLFENGDFSRDIVMCLAFIILDRMINHTRAIYINQSVFYKFSKQKAEKQEQETEEKRA